MTSNSCRGRWLTSITWSRGVALSRGFIGMKTLVRDQYKVRCKRLIPCTFEHVPSLLTVLSVAGLAEQELPPTMLSLDYQLVSLPVLALPRAAMQPIAQSVPSSISRTVAMMKVGRQSVETALEYVDHPAASRNSAVNSVGRCGILTTMLHRSSQYGAQFARLATPLWGTLFHTAWTRRLHLSGSRQRACLVCILSTRSCANHCRFRCCHADTVFLHSGHSSKSGSRTAARGGSC